MTDTPTDALIVLPPEPGFLTAMEGVRTIPWQPDGAGFTLHDLGQRLRNKQPVVAWLQQFNLELNVIQTDDVGTWFRLTTIEGGTQ